MGSQARAHGLIGMDDAQQCVGPLMVVRGPAYEHAHTNRKPLCTAVHARTQGGNGIGELTRHGDANRLEYFVARSKIVVDGAVGYRGLRGDIEQCNLPHLLTCDKTQCRVHQAATGALALLVTPRERLWRSRF
ncbi:hypothetical protein D3C73_1153380 [compost metagenome]